MVKPLHYTPDGEVIKTRIVKLIESLPGADRAIDIIYQTPDSIILPYIERAVKANKSPEQIIRVIKAAESNIFKDYQVAPWDEIHHGRMSLVSARNIRHMDPTARVETLNKLVVELGGPIGNSRFNLRGNAADRRSHTGGMIPKNRVTEEEMSGLNRPDRSQSMHPFGTNAQKDPRPGIVVTETSDPARFVDQALRSSKAQFNDTVSGRYSDMARRITVERMISGTRRGDISTETPLLYGTQAKPEDVKAAKIFLQEDGNGSLRLNMLRSWALPGTDQWETFMKDPINEGLAELYGQDLYNAGLGKETYVQVKNLAKENPTGLAIGAATNLVSDASTRQDIVQGRYESAAVKAGTAAVAGAASESLLKFVFDKGVLRVAQAVAPRVATGIVSAAGYVNPVGATLAAAQTIQGLNELRLDYKAAKQGKTTEQVKASMEASNKDQFRQAMGSTSAGYRRSTSPLQVNQALLSRVPTPVATNKPSKPKPKPAAKPINPINEALYIGSSLSKGKLPYSK